MGLRARSSVGQSSRLIIGRSQVRVLPGPLHLESVSRAVGRRCFFAANAAQCRSRSRPMPPAGRSQCLAALDGESCRAHLPRNHDHRKNTSNAVPAPTASANSDTTASALNACAGL